MEVSEQGDGVRISRNIEYIRRAAAFWISCRGLMAGAGRPASRELQ